MARSLNILPRSTLCELSWQRNVPAASGDADAAGRRPPESRSRAAGARHHQHDAGHVLARAADDAEGRGREDGRGAFRRLSQSTATSRCSGSPTS